MRAVLAALAALACGTVALAGAPPPAHASPAGFSDVICPEATHYVLEVGKLRIDDPPQRIYDAAHAAADVYERCSKDKLAHGFREAENYAATRGASFGVVAARALIALNRLDEARRDLLRYRERAQQVVDWQMETEAWTSADVHGFPVTIQGDHRPSMYRASAREIVESADGALAEIDRRDPLARRQAPAPSPTPAH